MKRFLAILVAIASLMAMLAGCGGSETNETTVPTTAEVTEPTETEPIDPTEGVDPENIYYVGPEREHKSLTQLFLDLKDDIFPKTIFVDEGTYDIFREYKEAGVPSPPADVVTWDYFDYNAFLPMNTRLIGVGQVRLEFNPSSTEITPAEAKTWAPLNIQGECYVENIEIYCKNGRYAIHDDSANSSKDRGTTHHYRNVRCIYEMSDFDAYGQRLGFNNTVGNGIAQGTTFLFEGCTFEFRGSEERAAFYTHESGSQPGPAAFLTFKNCTFLGGGGNPRTIRLQNIATGDVRVITTIENCTIEGGISLEILTDNSAQHFDVTLINSGNPPQMIADLANNRYPIKVYE